jgi:formylglycine-generating enzyme required for sulfatase activity
VVIIVALVGMRRSRRHVAAATEEPVRPSLAPACPKGTVVVPGGRYIMGERYDTAAAETFCMDVTEVTVAAYGACVAADACTEPNQYKADDPDKLGACNWKRPDAEQHPINCVDWEQAKAYCAWHNERLPTEDEWEWAARGGDEARRFPWGKDGPTAERLNACGAECVAWAKRASGKTWSSMYEEEDGWVTTAPVGSFPQGATPLGIQDMAGNVWEWTSSKLDRANKVTRGGGWSDFKPERVHASFRSSDAPATRSRSLGFRCAG